MHSGFAVPPAAPARNPGIRLHAVDEGRPASSPQRKGVGVLAATPGRDITEGSDRMNQV